MPGDHDKPTTSPSNNPLVEKALSPRLPMVLLRHDTPKGMHYDWMMGDAGASDPSSALLWTARVMLPTTEWANLGQWEVEPRAPHRREYLEFQGPIASGSGSVTRVDEGTYVPLQWAEDQKEFEISLRHFSGRVRLTRQTPTLWLAVVI